MVLLPKSLKGDLRQNLELVRTLHNSDIDIGRGYADVPGRLGLKYGSSVRDWPWRYVFPS